MKKDGQNELDETLAGGDKHYSRLLEELHLREREQWLILKSLPVIFYRVDPDGNLPTTWISEQIKTITGFSPRDFTENSTFWESRLHPDDHERVIKVYSETLTSGDTVLEYRWQCSDGSYHWFMDHLVVVKNPECDQADTIGICLDVTKSKLAEIALLESEKKYRLLTEYSVDVIWLLNTEGIVTFASPSVEKLCGFTPGEMLTRNMGDLMTPESSQRALETMIDAIRKFRDGEPYQVPGPVELEQ
ncbi:MAG: PAS domain-containing protein, partial [Bacteroidota bacterium]